MARIRGGVTIDAPVEEVFDLVADERNEPAYNPRIARAEQLGDGPVGPGSRFLATPRGIGRAGR
ncbi:SRPBCC family protein [Pedococcus sp. NPDC057267]|uniref:SRPBCC family protein n=1 Tax=Pedococcus sp. NPDC057267 TaxID=3346077 RepID=UPI00363CA9A1